MVCFNRIKHLLSHLCYIYKHSYKMLVEVSKLVELGYPRYIISFILYNGITGVKSVVQYEELNELLNVGGYIAERLEQSDGYIDWTDGWVRTMLMLSLNEYIGYISSSVNIIGEDRDVNWGFIIEKMINYHNHTYMERLILLMRVYIYSYMKPPSRCKYYFSSNSHISLMDADKYIACHNNNKRPCDDERLYEVYKSADELYISNWDLFGKMSAIMTERYNINEVVSTLSFHSKNFLRNFYDGDKNDVKTVIKYILDGYLCDNNIYILTSKFNSLEKEKEKDTKNGDDKVSGSLLLSGSPVNSGCGSPVKIGGVDCLVECNNRFIFGMILSRMTSFIRLNDEVVLDKVLVYFRESMMILNNYVNNESKLSIMLSNMENYIVNLSKMIEKNNSKNKVNLMIMKYRLEQAKSQVDFITNRDELK